MSDIHTGPLTYVFDAYGTLFDVHSAVRRHTGTIGESALRLSELWRVKQLEYSWVYALSGHYRDFRLLTEDALDFAFAAVPDANREARTALLEAYDTLDCYEEVPDALRALKASGKRTAILSNGTPDMIEAAVASAGIADLLDDCLSVDPLGTFKTDPRVYALVTETCGVEPSDVAFHSSNRWDIAGAKAFGFDCTWVNRTGQPDEYADLAPDRVVGNLRPALASRNA